MPESRVRTADSYGHRTHEAVAAICRRQARILAIARKPVQEKLILRVPNKTCRAIRVARKREPDTGQGVADLQLGAARSRCRGRDLVWLHDVDPKRIVDPLGDLVAEHVN